MLRVNAAKPRTRWIEIRLFKPPLELRHILAGCLKGLNRSVSLGAFCLMVTVAQVTLTLAMCLLVSTSFKTSCRRKDFYLIPDQCID